MRFEPCRHCANGMILHKIGGSSIGKLPGSSGGEEKTEESEFLIPVLGKSGKGGQDRGEFSSQTRKISGNFPEIFHANPGEKIFLSKFFPCRFARFRAEE